MCFLPKSGKKVKTTLETPYVPTKKDTKHLGLILFLFLFSISVLLLLSHRSLTLFREWPKTVTKTTYNKYLKKKEKNIIFLTNHHTYNVAYRSSLTLVSFDSFSSLFYRNSHFCDFVNKRYTTTKPACLPIFWMKCPERKREMEGNEKSTLKNVVVEDKIEDTGALFLFDRHVFFTDVNCNTRDSWMDARSFVDSCKLKTNFLFFF